MLIGSITLINTVGFRRSLNLQHRHLYPRPSGQESKRCDVQENVSYESNEEENDVLAWMKISNLGKGSKKNMEISISSEGYIWILKSVLMQRIFFLFFSGQWEKIIRGTFSQT